MTPKSRNSTCNGRFWILSPQGNRIKAQKAQYKEFLESGLKTGFSELDNAHNGLKIEICKVEFFQPSCWLYSVPNLLVF